MGFISSKEAAEKWSVSRRRVSTLCAENRIEGAIFMAGVWLIPEDSPKPPDLRKEKKRLGKLAEKS